MPNEVLQTVGTQILFADHAADWANGAAGSSLYVVGGLEVDMDLTSLAATPAGRESDKFDFGAKRAAAYSCMAAIESDGTGFTTGQTVDFYLASSPDSVAANGNPGGILGVDGPATTGYGLLSELLLQCLLIGSLVVENTINTVQVGHVGVFSPPERYGILIVVNNGGQAFLADAVEHHVVFNPIIDEVQ